MKRLFTAATIAVSLALVGVGGAQATDKPDKPDKLAKACHDLKKADKAAFNSLYGPKHAMRNCKRSKTPEAEEAIKNASKECKAERTADPEAFRATYGANENGKNAFGKCVSKKAREDVTDPPAE